MDLVCVVTNKIFILVSLYNFCTRLSDNEDDKDVNKAILSFSTITLLKSSNIIY